jgi:hypothetical protein
MSMQPRPWPEVPEEAARVAKSAFRRGGSHAVDSGYVSADLLVSSRLRGVTLLGPLLAGTSAQARGGGYTADMFAIDWDRRQATGNSARCGKRLNIGLDSGCGNR